MKTRLAWAALAATAMACEDLDQLAASACQRSATCADAGHAGGGAGSTGGGSGGAPGGGTAGGGSGTG
ncbi:MAG: hypothetical protein K1X89_31075, partial [Myxococcaceae bacterium]|nr:hypothetical protein [Myxococcaceae bacterium]